MPSLTAVTVGAEVAIDKVNAVLANCGPAAKPIVIVDDSYYRREAAATLLKEHVGLRVLAQNDLIKPLPPGPAAALPTLLELDSNATLREAAARCLLHSKIYIYLRQSPDMGARMAIAGNYCDALMRIYTTTKPPFIDLSDAEINQLSNKVEINMLKSLWYGYCHDDWLQIQQNLQKFAQNLHGPVVHLYHYQKVPYLVNHFLSEAAKHQDVTQITMQAPQQAVAIEQIWAGKASAEQLETKPVICKTETQAEAATAAITLVQDWLGTTKERIGIFSFDYSLRRSFNSLCGNHNIYLVDRGGWSTNKLFFGDLLLALVVADERKQQRLLQFFATWQEQNNHNWVAAVREALRENNILPPLHENLANSNWANTQQKHDLATWFTQLTQLLSQTAISKFIGDDPIGLALVQLINSLAYCFANDDTCKDQEVDIDKLRILLDNTLRNLTLVSSTADSNVQLVSLANNSSDQFDAVLLLGPNADNLPKLQKSEIFSEEVCDLLGLNSVQDNLVSERKALANLLARHTKVAAVWATSDCLASPLLEMLEPDETKPAPAAWEQAVAHHPLGMQAVVAKELPEKLSITSLDTLMDCPYKFHAQSQLGLRDDLPTTEYSPAKFGHIVHAILEQFHQDWEYPQDAATVLAQISTQQLAENTDANTKVYYHLWQPYIKPYAELMQEFVNQGGQISTMEEEISQELDLGNRKVTLSGKIDRVDSYPATDSIGIIDVKTGNLRTADLASGEKPQISIYAHIAKATATYVGIWQLKMSNGKPTINAILPANHKQITYVPELIYTHMNKVLAEITTGTALPANADEQICNSCVMHGLCRRQLWEQTPVSSHA